MLKHPLFGFFGLLVASTLGTAPVEAHTPVEFMEVLEGEPSNLIEHEVELKSLFDDQKNATDLKGPFHFSLPVGGMDRKVKKEKAYLAWYRIRNPKREAAREVKVLDMVRGLGADPLAIGSAEFFLSPAQRITTGPPSKIPDGLDHYKAYRVLNAQPLELDVVLSDSAGPARRRLGRPLYVCVAAWEWHHDEYFPASHPRDGFLVYELDLQEHSQSIGLIDQFGLNQIRTSKSRWLCVRAAILPSTRD